MQTPILKPGDRVTSRCSRCNDITGHTIVVILDNGIHKAECCICKGIHRYKPPTPPGTPVKAPRRVTSDKTNSMPKAPKQLRATPASSRAARDAEVLRHDWQYALNNTINKPAPYSMAKPWQLAEVVEHPTFGVGVIVEILPPDKMQVLFRDGARLLKKGVA